MFGSFEVRPRDNLQGSWNHATSAQLTPSSNQSEVALLQPIDQYRAIDQSGREK
jgi:hypothetical protein